MPGVEVSQWYAKLFRKTVPFSAAAPLALVDYMLSRFWLEEASLALPAVSHSTLIMARCTPLAGCGALAVRHWTQPGPMLTGSMLDPIRGHLDCNALAGGGCELSWFRGRPM